MGKDQELLEAARSGNVVVVEKLLSSKSKRGGPLASLRRGPGANVQDASGYSSLHHASLNGHREIVALLLENEASPNIVDHKGSTPLHLAAWAGHSDIVRLLLSTQIRVTQLNLKNKDNETALHCASQYGHTAVVGLLLNYGADPSIRSVKDETALDLAALYGRLETVEILLKKHPELIEVYRSCNKDSVSSFRTTPLHAASRNGHRGVVDVLLKAGFPVSLLTLTGTALHEAALCGKVDVVRRLLEAGIDVSLRDSSSQSALQIVQDLPTPVAQEITSLIQNSALLANLAGDTQLDPHQETTPPFPYVSAIGSPYENVVVTRNSKGTCDFKVSSAADSYITLPRRCPRTSTTSSHSQNSDGSIYEVPPPPRSLPWLQSRDGKNRDATSSSQSDLLSDDSIAATILDNSSDHPLSRSYDERSTDFMSMSIMSCPPCEPNHANENSQIDGNRKIFSRSSRARHSVDQYLPMFMPSQTKVSPNPPQKPPRKTQPIASHFDSMPRLSRGQKSRQNSSGGISTSSSGYELVYMARTGSREDAHDSKVSGKLRIQSGYVEMAPGAPATPVLSSYENVSPFRVVEECNYDIPRDLGGFKTYENVSFNSTPRVSTSTSISSSTNEQPPTPDHPPPAPHLAEQRIHDRIRPLSEELKRQSRDIETETEEELFLTISNSHDTTGNGSVSLSLSDRSISAENIEEVTSDTPFAGLMRGSIPTNSCLERPRSLQAKNESKKSIDQSLNSVECRMSSGSIANRRKTNSLSVLSPFDEQEEWTKIREILGSLSSGMGHDSDLIDEVQREVQNKIDSMAEPKEQAKPIEAIDVPVARNDTLSDWLLSMGLQQYLGLFIVNGFDEIDFLADGILDDNSLREMGIDNEEHRCRLKENATLLTTPLSKMKSCPPSSVDDWLRLLKLEQYAEQFKKNLFDDMQRVERVWEVELTTLIEIRKLGHLRRILVSVENKTKPTDKVSVKEKVFVENDQDLQDLTSDLQKISTNIARLEDEINQKMVENISDPCGKRAGTLGRRKSRPAPQPPKSSTILLHNAIDELSIRDPCQLVDGVTKSVVTQWRHKSQDLIKPGIGYKAQYLGSTLVKHLKGTESTKRSIQKLKTKHSTDSSLSASVLLAISLNGVQFLSPMTKETICKHDIRNIHCACQDADDLTHFAYITKDHETQDHYCHVFCVPSMDLATEIILTLGQAFEVAYQLVLFHEVRSETSQQCQISDSRAERRDSEQSAPTPGIAAAKQAPVDEPVQRATDDSDKKASCSDVPVKKTSIGPKPAILPPKPKLSAYQARPHQSIDKTKAAFNNSHTRSYSTTDCTLLQSTCSTAIENKQQSESDLLKYQESAKSQTCDSPRAPLAAEEEL